MSDNNTLTNDVTEDAAGNQQTEQASAREAQENETISASMTESTQESRTQESESSFPALSPPSRAASVAAAEDEAFHAIKEREKARKQQRLKQQEEELKQSKEAAGPQIIGNENSPSQVQKKESKARKLKSSYNSGSSKQDSSSTENDTSTNGPSLMHDDDTATTELNQDSAVVSAATMLENDVYAKNMARPENTNVTSTTEMLENEVLEKQRAKHMVARRAESQEDELSPTITKPGAVSVYPDDSASFMQADSSGAGEVVQNGSISNASVENASRDDEEALVSAFLVQSNVPHAQVLVHEDDETSEPSQEAASWWRRRRGIIAIAVACLAVVGIVLGIAIPLSQDNNSTNQDDLALVVVGLLLDDHPEETGWKLSCQEEEIASVPAGTYTEAFARVFHRELLSIGTPCVLAMTDLGNNGMNGGNFSVWVDVSTNTLDSDTVVGHDELVVNGDGVFLSTIEKPFLVMSPKELALITIVIQLDGTPQDTGIVLTCSRLGEEPILDVPAGTLTTPNTVETYEERLPLGDECVLVISDASNNGIINGSFGIFYGTNTTDLSMLLAAGTGVFLTEVRQPFLVGPPPTNTTRA